MIIDIVYNITLLLALGVIYAILPFKEVGKARFELVVAGLVIGLAGLLIMARPFTLGSGIVYDSRSILISVSGMFFGLVPTVIASIILIANRIIIGGSGVYTGITTIVCSALVGILWNVVRLPKISNRSMVSVSLEFYITGLITHIFMLLAVVFFPPDQVLLVMKAIALSVLIVYPIGSYLLSMVLYNQRLSNDRMIRLQSSELRFKTMFKQAPIGMSLTNIETGCIVDVNEAYLDMLLYDKQELLSDGWTGVIHPDDVESARTMMSRVTAGENGPFLMDARLIRKDKHIIWVSFALTTVHPEHEGKQLVLCMTTDISQRKITEQRVMFANTHDSLTQLYNRHHFEDYIRHLNLKRLIPLTVAFGDINGLGLINDAFGRKEGDRLLRLVAAAIQNVLSADGYIARVGSDEFAIVLPKTESSEAETILQAIKETVSSEKIGNSVQTSITFGFETIHIPNQDVNEAIRRAETDVNRRKMLDSPSMRGKAIDAIIHTLHEKNWREELHSRRVSVLCERLAVALGLTDRQVSEMRTVGLLHDIGKIAISDSILNKEGKLDNDEWNEMKRHPEIGYRILGAVSEMTDFADFVLAHHERLDGKGYPRGLKNSEIPIQSRIIAIADAYDAMTSERTYRTMFTDQEAVQELRRCGGTQFDSEMVEVFIEKVIVKTPQ